MSDEYSDPAGESEMRRRAAWLLAMLAVVAVLLVTLMVIFLSSNNNQTVGNPIASIYPTAPANPSTSAHAGKNMKHHQRHGGGAHANSASASSSSSVSVPPRSTDHTVNCPSSQPCIADGDIGNAVAAINDYRKQNGQPAVDGTVTQAAQNCALTNGSNCTGSWAESQVAAANGQQALHKILPFAHGLLDPSLSSLQVGWAYDPSAKQFYFALIENG